MLKRLSMKVRSCPQDDRTAQDDKTFTFSEMRSIERLLAHRNAGLERIQPLTEARTLTTLTMQEETFINFSSNDYLGLAQHPAVKKACCESIEKYGVGSSASFAVSGYFAPHQHCEEKCAAFLNRESAILFNTGYLANLGVITTFATPHRVILADKHCHASLLDGIILSRAKHYRYRHHDLSHCENLLRAHPASLLITEGVFSMDGSISALPALSKLAKQNNALLMVDDAHGLGELGQTGRGTPEHHHLSEADIPILVTPLGKAMGCFGAIVAGRKEVIESLRQFAKTYRYTTALPPAIASAIIAALDIIEKETWRYETLQALIQFFIEEAKSRNLQLASGHPTPIQSIMVGTSQKALSVQNKLRQRGYFVSCIRPPTVPKNTARIRISLNCLQQQKDIIGLLDLLNKND